MLSRGATAFMQAGRARLMTTGLRSAAASRSWRTPAAGASVARSRRMARLSSSSGITTAKMVATDIFPDLKGAAIMEKFEHVKEDVVEEYGAKVAASRSAHRPATRQASPTFSSTACCAGHASTR